MNIEYTYKGYKLEPVSNPEIPKGGGKGGEPNLKEVFK